MGFVMPKSLLPPKISDFDLEMKKLRRSIHEKAFYSLPASSGDYIKKHKKDKKWN